ncbi:MAG: HNH endonuclease [Acidimicrobiaceae bacterium]|nr:HNH endonuclease [Acidimicrobiaceae bacterium]
MGDGVQGEGPVRPRNLWRRFRAWPLWAQIVSWVVAFFVAVGAIGAATGGSTSTTNVATETAPTTTTTVAPTTTSEAPTTTSTSTSTTSTTVAPTPETLAPADPVAPPAESALAGLASLAVKGRAPKTGYSRDQFGPAWADNVSVAGGHNGCDTRNDILRRDLTNIGLKPGSGGCIVLTGTLHDPYSNTTIAFVRGATTSQSVQIDHVVALADAWQKGAQQLTISVRTDFANDPLNLLAVSGTMNQQKGDSDAASWLPPNRAFRCPYVARQIAVKVRYHLWVTAAERDAMTRVLSTCPNQTLPAEGTRPSIGNPGPPAPQTPTTVAPPAPAPSPPPTAPPAPAPSPSGPLPVVHPGSFCAHPGARGMTSIGTPMVCKLDSAGRRYRWARG